MRKLVLLLLAGTLVLAAQVVPDLYIVELSGDPATTLKSARASLGDRRAMVQAAQDDFRRRLASAVPGARALDSVDTVANALIVRLPDSEVARLSTMPGVVRIHAVHEVKLELDHAVPLHKVPEAWAQIGGEDRAGLGVKIGIIDTGIDISHPGFQDESLDAPAGFPKVNDETFRRFTNKKVIVARAYGQLLGDLNSTPADNVGHGTGTSMAAAGVRNKGPLGSITGVAPKAYLGNYNVFNSDGRSTRSDVLLKALDDAVADGMNVVNMSLGVEPSMRPDVDIIVEAVERASRAGVIVVKSAGNNGGDLNRPNFSSISSPGTAPSAITVGASFNDRFFFTGLEVDGQAPIIAFPGNGPTPETPVRGVLVDVAQMDSTSLACTSLPGGSLTGNVVLILRGTCNFEDKLNNAQAAGAAGAVVYTDAARPPGPMDVIGATLPAVMITNADGVRLKRMIAENSGLSGGLVFDFEAFPLDANELASFSAKGPNTDQGIKPDISAAGIEISTAAQASNPAGELFSSSGYALVDGTSFSAPIVAGAVAVVRGARPNLTAPQLRSVIINSASKLQLASGPIVPVQQTGAGVLQVAAALANTTAAEPSSLSFGTGSGTVDFSRDISITNLSSSPDTFSITVQPFDGSAPVDISTTSLDIAEGQTAKFQAKLSLSGREASEHQGFIVIRGSRSTVDTRVPYWYVVASKTPAAITILNAPSSGAVEGTVRVLLRVSDKFGVPIPDMEIKVTPLAGSGTLVSADSVDGTYPGVYSVRLRLGPNPGSNRFRFEAGDISASLTITGNL